jgi:tetratricopeptide (TPR) repeat protein
MQHAHQRGLIHRDLKPGNVLLASGGDTSPGAAPNRRADAPPLADLVPKISDFGLVKRLEEGSVQTQTGEVLGTPSYMAPEQATGRTRDVGPHTDVWALGAILYELLTGRPPFLGSTPLDTLLQVKGQDPVPVRRLQPGVPRDLETITLKCLRKEPARRYATAAGLAEDLNRFLEGRPILARPVGLAERAWRWSRRNPWVAGLAGMLVVAVTLGFALVTQQWLRAERSLKTARQAVRKSFLRLSEIELSKEPGTHALQRRLLEDALAYFQGFLDERPDSPEMRADLAEAHFLVGNITSKIGSTKDALPHYRRARELWEAVLDSRPSAPAKRALASNDHNLGEFLVAEGQVQEGRRYLELAQGLRGQLAEEHPEDRDYRHDLARTHLRLGALHAHVGERALARTLYEKARGELERLLAEGPPLPAAQRELAQTYVNLGGLDLEAGQRDAALGRFKQSMEVRKRLVAGDPTNAEYQFDLAESCRHLGRVQHEAGAIAEAQESYEEARAIQEKLLRANPGVLAYQSALGRTYTHLGNLSRWTKRRDEALRWHQQALPLYQAVVAADPARTGYLSDLAGVHYNLANLQREMGRRQEAVASTREAIRCQERLVQLDPAATKYQSDLAMSYRTLGMLQRQVGQHPDALRCHRRACEVLRKLIQIDPAEINHRGDLAFNLQDIGIVYLDANQPGPALTAFEEAMLLQRQLVKEYPDNRLFRYDLALTHHNIGCLHEQALSCPKARDAFTEAAVLWEDLVAAEPANTRYWDGLAKTCYSLSEVDRKTGREPESRCYMVRVRDIYEALVAADPDVPEFREELARARLAIAGMEERAGRLAEALHHGKLALELSRQAFAADPLAVSSRQGLAGTYNFLGRLLAQAGRTDEALLVYEEARALGRQLVKEAPPADPQFPKQFAESYRGLGDARREKGQASRALPLYQEGVRLAARALTINWNNHLGDPAAAEHRVMLAASYNLLGDLLRKAGRTQEGLLACEEGLARGRELLREQPDDLQYQEFVAERCCGVANARRERGEYAQALALYQEAVRRYREAKSPQCPRLYEIACEIARAGDARPGGSSPAEDWRRRFGDLAMEALRLAAAGGFTPANALAEAPALAPLRERDDFKKLVAELQEKAAATP